MGERGRVYPDAPALHLVLFLEFHMDTLMTSIFWNQFSPKSHPCFRGNSVVQATGRATKLTPQQGCNNIFCWHPQGVMQRRLWAKPWGQCLSQLQQLLLMASTKSCASDASSNGDIVLNSKLPGNFHLCQHLNYIVSKYLCVSFFIFMCY